jgi:hypothetical protein
MTGGRWAMCELSREDDLSAASRARSHSLLRRMPRRQPKNAEVVEGYFARDGYFILR